MKTNKRIISLMILSMGLTACTEEGENSAHGLQQLPFFNTPEFTPEWPAAGTTMSDCHQIGTFNFINQNNENVSNETFDGKIYVVDFFFTSCGSICPKMTRNMAALQEAFLDDDDVMLLSHSVTPDADSVPRLKEYAEAMGVNDNKWHLVTGEKEEIYSIARKSYFAEERMGFDRDVNAFLHTENFILVDKNGHIRGIYNGTLKVEVNRIIEDIRVLQKEI